MFLVMSIEGSLELTLHPYINHIWYNKIARRRDLKAKLTVVGSIRIPRLFQNQKFGKIYVIDYKTLFRAYETVLKHNIPY